MTDYVAFGLTVRSSHPVAGLVAAPCEGAVDLYVWFDAVPDIPAVHGRQRELWYASQDTDRGAPTLQVWRIAGGAFFRFLYADGTEFVVEGTGHEVWARWTDASTIEDTITYLLGPVVGFVLRLRGTTCLHGSVVAIGESAVAFLGAANAGKSTIAALFARKGHAIVADDVVVLAERDGMICAAPAYPQLRLRPDAVSMLYGSVDALPRFTPTWDRRCLDLVAPGSFASTTVPLRCIYVLDERVASEAPRISALSKPQSLLALIANGYGNHLLHPDHQRRQFACLSAVSTRVPVRMLAVPAGVDRMGTLYDGVFDDCAELCVKT
jgi:hypothetical protein